MINIEVTPSMAADAFYNGELEHELQQIGMIAFKHDSDRETCGNSWAALS